MRSEADHHISKFFRDRQGIRLQPPIITSSDCEGAGEVFTVNSKSATQRKLPQEFETSFFRSPKYLTVSSQLHLEAFVHDHPKVWTLSPTFRAEKSDTPRHVSEFWMLEAELRTESLEEIMQLVEDMIRALVEGLKDSLIPADLKMAARKAVRGHEDDHASNIVSRWERLLRPSWQRIKYEDVIKRLQEAHRTREATFHHEPSWDGGLQLEHEKWIASEIGLGSPLFVTHYPQSIKPFYMLPSPSKGAGDHATVECFDLLLPEVCEIVGGSLREHRHEDLSKVMAERGMSASGGRPAKNLEAFASPPGHPQIAPEATPSSEPGTLEWYLELRRFGSVPHGGFGLGFDRLLGYLAGVNNIKDMVPWPRYYGHCEC